MIYPPARDGRLLECPGKKRTDQNTANTIAPYLLLQPMVTQARQCPLPVNQQEKVSDALV